LAEFRTPLTTQQRDRSEVARSCVRVTSTKRGETLFPSRSGFGIGTAGRRIPCALGRPTGPGTALRGFHGSIGGRRTVHRVASCEVKFGIYTPVSRRKSGQDVQTPASNRSIERSRQWRVGNSSAGIDHVADIHAIALHRASIQTDALVRQAVHRPALRAVGSSRHVQCARILWDSTQRQTAASCKAGAGFPAGIRALVQRATRVGRRQNVQTRGREKNDCSQGQNESQMPILGDLWDVVQIYLLSHELFSCP